MKLKSLLQHIEQEMSPEALPANWGDAYLLKHNLIFRKVREQVVAAGFRFSHEPESAYFSLPMSQLDSILKSKAIPYFDNTTILKALEQKMPGQLEWDHVADNLKGNFMLHESCHGIARAFTRETISDQWRKNQKFADLLLILVEESFANTCELLAIADAKEPAHRIFFEKNSYICMFEDRTHIRNAIDEFGLENLFHMLLLSYIHSNFQFQNLDEKYFERFLKLASKQGFTPSEKFKKVSRALSRNAFALNPRFRTWTTEFYLHLQKIKPDELQGCAKQYLEIIEKSSELQKLISQLCRACL